MKPATYLSIVFVAVLFFMVQVSPAFGSGVSPGTGGTQPAGVVNPASGFNLTNPINVGSICGLMKKALDFILAIGSPVAALFLIYAGFQFVVARGKPEALKKARTNLVNVVLGIAIFMAAWLLGQVIANTLKSISPTNISSINSCS